MRQLLRSVRASEGAVGGGSEVHGVRARPRRWSIRHEKGGSRTKAQECRIIGDRTHLELESPYFVVSLPVDELGNREIWTRGGSCGAWGELRGDKVSAGGRSSG